MRVIYGSLVLVAMLAVSGFGAEKPERKQAMDYGPVLATSVVRKVGDKAQVVAHKGLVVRVAGDRTIVFDMDLLTYAAGWGGGFLDFRGTMMTNNKGTSMPAPAGGDVFVSTGPGCGRRMEDGKVDFSDPRADKAGPLPRERGRYEGMYVNGDAVVLAYSVNGADVLDLPGYDAATSSFTRTVQMGKRSEAVSLVICDAPGKEDYRALVTDGTASVVVSDDLFVMAQFLYGDAALEIQGGRVVLTFSKGERTVTARVWLSTAKDRGMVLKRAGKVPLGDIGALIKGGVARWKPVVLKGNVSADSAGYVVDQFDLPEANPWNSWMRLTGLDFFSDGRMAVSTLNGDVWIVAGVDEKLASVTWRRYASGLYEPLGLRVVNDLVYVRGRDQITRLHDLNGDGETDWYENFNNDGPVNPTYHGFAMELATDSKGDFYFSRAGHRAEIAYPGHGRVTRVSADGKTSEHLCSGIRVANGLGVGPNDEIAIADNQGNWVPTSKIHLVKRGDFLGFTPQHHGEKEPTTFAEPLCWLPHSMDSSSGSPMWVSSEKWGPLKGNLLLSSFGRSSLILVLPQKEGHRAQASVVAFPMKFDSGIMRGRFHPIDGQLYMCGVGGGWQAGGPKDGGLYRVRYTGKPVTLPVGAKVTKDGVSMTFAIPLDRSAAEDDGNYGAERWNYRWTEAYGSADYSLDSPEKKGRDEVEISSVKLSGDGRTVVVGIEHLKPVHQLSIRYKLKGATGERVEGELVSTVNFVAAK